MCLKRGPDFWETHKRTYLGGRGGAGLWYPFRGILFRQAQPKLEAEGEPKGDCKPSALLFGLALNALTSGKETVSNICQTATTALGLIVQPTCKALSISLIVADTSVKARDRNPHSEMSQVSDV